ncbi:bZIP transcription factor [Parabacteroides gordonii]|uniref:bZIP transcription factor n=1 Tax=Parabacteroides gordonii TaxID=574930 RepID=UPI000EC2AD9F|nr:bZIP transcription factor [Parabacteroides gordonii]RGP17255.1 hypothetical protein DXB27_07295 [Parabacteroides gordonii]
MEDAQKHYLNELLDYLKLSASAFAKSIGYDSPNRIYYILRLRNGVSKEVAKDITDAYPDVNYNWLLTGKGDMLRTGSIHVVGDGNISNTGITGGDVAMGTDQEVMILKKRIKELEAEVKELKNDKAILKEFVTMLQNKK